MHALRVRKHSDPFRVDPPPALPRMVGTDHPNWSGADVGYGAAHIRIRKSRGSATKYPCSNCTAMASEWAYDHTDPEERVDARFGRPYSVDQDRYMPLCVSCHRAFDASQAKAKRGDSNAPRE